MTLHRFDLRVYYEDTDMAGIVYYANYLKFIERGRSEWIREIGVDQNAMKEAGVVFVVRRVEADYFGSARLDDVLTVETSPEPPKGVRMSLTQQVKRGEDLLFEAKVLIVTVGPNGRPTRLPPEIAAAFGR